MTRWPPSRGQRKSSTRRSRGSSRSPRGDPALFFFAFVCFSFFFFFSHFHFL
jgi:hypothetical protein